MHETALKKIKGCDKNLVLVVRRLVLNVTMPPVTCDEQHLTHSQHDVQLEQLHVNEGTLAPSSDHVEPNHVPQHVIDLGSGETLNINDVIQPSQSLQPDYLDYHVSHSNSYDKLSAV
jgi:hypothetical protein